MLFEPVRKTQDAMFFFMSEDGGGSTWTPCGPKQPGAVQTTMEELAAQGMADQVKHDKQQRVILPLLPCSSLAQAVFPVAM